MVWSVCLLGETAEGKTERIDLITLGQLDAPIDADDLGVNLATSKELLSELQQAIVAIQEVSLRALAKCRAAKSPDISIKDYRAGKFQSLFRTVCIRIPCLNVERRIENALPGCRFCRSTREFDDLRVKISAWMSYSSAMDLLGEMYPVKDGKSAQTAMRKIAVVTERLTNLTSASAPVQEDPIALPLDTTLMEWIPPSNGIAMCQNGEVSPSQ